MGLDPLGPVAAQVVVAHALHRFGVRHGRCVLEDVAFHGQLLIFRLKSMVGILARFLGHYPYLLLLVGNVGETSAESVNRPWEPRWAPRRDRPIRPAEPQGTRQIR